MGKIKPGSKLKFIIRATLQEEKELPITGRTCLVRMQVTAKKGETVIKTQNYRKENMSNLFLNYTVPEGADTLEVIESFVLTNKSEDSKFNQKVTTLNKLVLSAREEILAAAAANPGKDNSPDKKVTASGKPDGKNGKGPGNKADVEAEERFTRMVSGAALLVLLAGVGIYFFLKNRKSNRIASDRLKRKEQLRLQAIERQKQLQQNSPPEETREKPREKPREETQQDTSGADGQTVAGAAGMTQEHFCRNCGAPLKPGSKFCENCGTKAQ